MLASTILSKAAAILFDETNVRWTQAELLTHLNRAQRIVVDAAPQAGTVKEVALLGEGARQSLPTGGIRLLDMPRNLTENVTLTAGKGTATASGAGVPIVLPVTTLDAHVGTATAVGKPYTLPAKYTGIPFVGGAYVADTTYNSLNLNVSGTWAAGLRPDRIRVTIVRVGSNVFSQVGFNYVDGSYGYQWDTGSTYGILSGSTAGTYVHEAVILEGGINTHLGDLHHLSFYSNDSTDVLFTGDYISNIEFKIGGTWVPYL